MLTVDEIYAQAGESLFQKLKEDRRIERKPGGIHVDALAEYFSMWANTVPEGGVIVIGMENDGSISGLSAFGLSKVNALEKTGMTNCSDARYETKRISAARSTDNYADYLLVIRVYYHPTRVVRTSKGDAFIRLGDSKKRLRPEEIRELEIDKGQVPLELEPCGLGYPDDFDSHLISLFTASFQDVRKLTGHGDIDILELARLGKKGPATFLPNNACALLFAKDPLVRFSGCKIRFLRFEGDSEGSGERWNAVKDITVEGNIPTLIVEAAKTVESQIRQFSHLGSDGRFYTAPEYPTAAWYEAIVNACVHRSYGLGSMNIFIKMFEDRLEIESPGGFPPPVTPENIYEMHQPRNPYLMEVLRYLDFVKCAHEGTRRMRDTMVNMKLPGPEFRQKEAANHSLFRVTLKNDIRNRKVWVDSDVSSIVGEAVLRDLSEHEQRAINFAARYGDVSVSAAQRLTGRTWPSAKKLLMGLVEKDILRHRIRSALDRDPQARFEIRSPRGNHEAKKPSE